MSPACIMGLGAAIVAAAGSSPAPAEPKWQTLQPGVELTQVRVVEQPDVGDGLATIVRIDPSRAQLVARAAAALDGRTRTARDWSREHALVAVINAGMYATDFSTHTGYFRAGKHLNSSTWLPAYKSVLAFAPKSKAAVAPLVMRDTDESTFAPASLDAYDVVVQNLRLIKGPKRLVWTKSARRWSEAALALDRDHHLLFIFVRSPLSMRELTERLIGLPLGITHMMHAEGGPEASLSIHGGGLDIDQCGSYETGFNENDSEREQWPIPNIIGVVRQP